MANDVNAKKNALHVEKKHAGDEVFGRNNYILLLISMGIVALGFILMSGTTDIFSQVKILVAPMVVLFGFAFGIYAILKR